MFQSISLLILQSVYWIFPFFTHQQIATRINGYLIRVLCCRGNRDGRAYCLASLACRSVDMHLFGHGNKQLRKTMARLLFANKSDDSYLLIISILLLVFLLLCKCIFKFISTYLLCYLRKLLIVLLLSYYVCIM